MSEILSVLLIQSKYNLEVSLGAKNHTFDCFNAMSVFFCFLSCKMFYMIPTAKVSAV